MTDSSEMRTFFEKCKAAGGGDFRKECGEMLEAIGTEFLRIIQDEIIRRKIVDTRLLLSSFHKGSSDNVWELNESGLMLEVGTNVEYAAYVNDGHWTCSKGEAMRFVPGRWNGDRFEYDPSAKTGMMLKQKWVEGKHFWQDGLNIIEKMLPGILEAKIQQWLDRYFG
ncbi:MAG: HK97 gp10 family phage protein [Porcipelethomonas sp.]